MDVFKPIPVREIAMSRGINVGGFLFRTYQTGPVWQLHLHPIGGYVSLHHTETNTTYYVSLAQTETVEGYKLDVPNALDNGVRAVSQYISETQGLVPNQHRIDVPHQQVNAVDGAKDLGEPSDADKRAKDAHFGTEQPETKEGAKKERPCFNAQFEIPNDSVHAPVKKKRGRPRKIRIDEAQSLS